MEMSYDWHAEKVAAGAARLSIYPLSLAQHDWIGLRGIFAEAPRTEGVILFCAEVKKSCLSRIGIAPIVRQEQLLLLIDAHVRKTLHSHELVGVCHLASGASDLNSLLLRHQNALQLAIRFAQKNKQHKTTQSEQSGTKQAEKRARTSERWVHTREFG